MINLKILRWEDYLGGPNVSLRVLTSERGGQEGQYQSDVRRE